MVGRQGLQERGDALVGEGIDEGASNQRGASPHKIVGEHQDFLMVLHDALEVLQLKLLVAIELYDIVNDMPILLNKIALVNEVGAKGKTACELGDLWVLQLDTSEDDVAASGAHQAFRVVVEAGGLHEEGKRGVSLI